jgi:hypothetical protein
MGGLTAKHTTTTPDATQRHGDGVASVRGDRGLEDLQGLSEGAHLEEVQPGTKQEVGELDRLLLQRSWRWGQGGGGHRRTV